MLRSTLSLPGSAEPPARKAVEMDAMPATDLAALPAAYRAWRASDLGRITDHIEEELIFALIGSTGNARILDVGCGDGVLSIRLAQRGAHVTGLDADQGMIDAARDRASKAHAAITFVQGNAGSLPFADGTFDVVVAVTVLCFVPDGQSAVREMARVLRPGGRLILGELGRYSTWAARRRISGWLGSRVWRAATFRSAGDLEQIAINAKLKIAAVRGAIYYPPYSLCARWLAPFDRHLAAMTTLGAAFIALAATKPSAGGQRDE
jgi:ubiquinone biosynthesis O-methyltransferase